LFSKGLWVPVEYTKCYTFKPMFQLISNKLLVNKSVWHSDPSGDQHAVYLTNHAGFFLTFKPTPNHYMQSTKLVLTSLVSHFSFDFSFKMKRAKRFFVIIFSLWTHTHSLSLSLSLCLSVSLSVRKSQVP
jgi:hypothetical protein